MQPNWAAPMSNPAQPRPVPHQASPTQVGQREHPEDARWQAQVQKLTQIGTHRTAQAGSTKSSLLQWSQYLERTPTKFPSFFLSVKSMYHPRVWLGTTRDHFRAPGAPDGHSKCTFLLFLDPGGPYIIRSRAAKTSDSSSDTTTPRSRFVSLEPVKPRRFPPFPASQASKQACFENSRPSRPRTHARHRVSTSARRLFDMFCGRLSRVLAGLNPPHHRCSRGMFCFEIKPGTCEISSPPPLSRIQSVATGRDAIGSAAGAARGRRCVYMDCRGGRGPRPK